MANEPKIPARIEIDQDGSVRVIIGKLAGVSFETAAARMKLLETTLGLAGLDIRYLEEPERHLHGPETTGTHTHTHS